MALFRRSFRFLFSLPDCITAALPQNELKINQSCSHYFLKTWFLFPKSVQKYNDLFKYHG